MLCEPLIMVNSLLERRRVAHVPNVSALLVKPAAGQVAPSSASGPAVTTVRTAPSSGSRLAHTATTASVARPRIPAEFGGKVPTAIRQRYLDHFCNDLLKINPNNEAEAFRKALEEEQSVYNRSSSRRVYVNVAVTSVKRLRDAAAAAGRGTWLVVPSHRLVYHMADLYAPYSALTPAPLPLVLRPPLLVASCPNQSVYLFSSVPRPPARPCRSYGAVAAPVANRTVSHLDVLAGKGGATGSWSIERSKKADDVKAEELYDRLQQYLLTADQLDENGFPRCDGRGRPGHASLAHVDGRQKVTLRGATCRQCLRCSRAYGVSPTDYTQLVPDQCVYHWGRVFTRRGQKLYSCCMQDAPADGCCVADCHVSDAFDPDHMDGFVATMDKPEPVDGNHGVYALDCEMCYTVHGSELTRITVIDAHGATVFESLVRPSTPIIDYNTRFSGIKASDMAGVNRSIRDVQAVLLNMFSSRTILIGHSLESDFKALKLIHSTVVDTSVVFPHKLGRPFKRALRNLCSDYLKRIIQNDVGGHDSAEDAISCMDLMLWRLKEDAKSRH